MESTGDRPSISAFFPCYNDARTIADLVLSVGDTLASLTDDFEVIVVNDGSQDESAAVLAKLQKSCDYLRVVTHEQNRGYGGALRSGFASASKELVFYTDGDAQYDPRELSELHRALAPEVDMVQGWKARRSDPLYRTLVGWAYCQFVRWLFGLQTRDVDCDFRLMRRRVLEAIPLVSTGGSITVELVARIEQAGFVIRELPVHHFPRRYGRSQFFRPLRIARTFWELGRLWFELHLGRWAEEPAVPAAIPTQSP
jgi:glycosyltransferase involved in cell wall biosynthesis